MTRVVIRVDSGAEAGLGHLRRCLALAAALTERGLEPELIVPRDKVAIAKAKSAEIHAVELDAEPGSNEDLRGVSELARGARALVVDSYAWQPEAFAAVQQVTPTVAIADLGGAFACSIVVDGGPDAAPAKYAGGNAELLVGPRYALLSRDLWELEQPGPPAGPSVLLTFGGGSGEELARLTAAIAATTIGDVVVVAGPYADAEVIRAAAPTAKVVEAPPTLTSLFAAATVVVTSGGQTLLEVLRMGVPAVVVEVASNQAPGIAAATARGAVVDAGVFDAEAPERVAEIVGSVLSDAGTRERLTAAGQDWVDGLGARRVAARIDAL
jgi:spore coat polysaccharide biosynthesis predicted glycosyltransferase SpsG